MLIFTTVTSIGIFSVAVNTDPINYYEEDHPVAISANLINKNLGGLLVRKMRRILWILNFPMPT
jgi:hypothetical protein